MSEARDLAQAHYQAFNERDFSRAKDIYSPDVVTVEPGSGRIDGLDAFLAHTQVFLTAFPDAHLDMLTLTDGQHRVVIEGTFAGTHTGPLPSPGGELPPTGRSLRLAICDVWEVEAGRVSRHHVYYDQMSFLTQLGLIPETAPA